ncbi:MAG: hypothetical protein ABR593_02015 [Candidatus Limnocylindria bacterium]
MDAHQLAGELTDARATFLEKLDRVLSERGPDTKLAGEWGARELVAHLGYWAGHVAEAIHAVEQGRGDEFEVGDQEVAVRNETVARVARQASFATVRRREAASVEALTERLEALDPALLDTRLATWGTLHDGIREDGAIHYRVHADDLAATEPVG